MDIQMLYWHWLVLGLLLVVGEIFIPSFTILWFGLGALVVGLVELLIPMSLSVQILLWTVSSVVFTLVWFKSIKVKMAQGNRGEEARNDAIGASGLVTKLPTQSTQGRIRFSTPVMDSDEWEFSCDSVVELGDRLHIKEVSGDFLVVTKLN
ncbi:MAG: NfeD family protein [Porticoccaceae bacterium]|nr:NfeD family protein [Porticoccaceae bacterium]